MRDVLPTFRDNRDRIVYLLTEYRVTVSLVGLVVSVWLIFFPPAIPTIPPRYLWFAAGFATLVPFGAIFGIKLAHWLHEPDIVRVAVCDPDPDGEEYSAYAVPTQVWDNKEVEGSTPLYPDNGTLDAVVTRWDYFGDTESLVVRGVERSDLTPAEALEDRDKVDQFHEHHHEIRRNYARLKARLHRKITEVHDLVIMRMMEEQEDADLAISKKPSDMIDDMESAVEELPDGPGTEPEAVETFEQDADAGDVTMTGMNSDPETAADGGREQ